METSNYSFRFQAFHQYKFPFSLQARHFFHLEEALEVAGPSKTPPKKNVNFSGADSEGSQKLYNGYDFKKNAEISKTI